LNFAVPQTKTKSNPKQIKETKDCPGTLELLLKIQMNFVEREIKGHKSLFSFSANPHPLPVNSLPRAKNQQKQPQSQLYNNNALKFVYNIKGKI
jgi:hypothetical protein